MSSCLSVDIRKASISLDANISKIGDVLSLDVAKLDGIEVSASLYTPCIKPMVFEMGAHLEVSCSIICDIGVGEFIRFALSVLQWVGDDNAEGVVKYNKLTASGDWSLEEVEIEEML